MDRRKFLMMVGAAGGSALASGSVQGAQVASSEEFNAVLVDTTLCVGCRSCEEACAEAHGLPAPDVFDESVFENERTTTTEQWTVVNRYGGDESELFAKKQCMHCAQPACAAACLTKAMLKTEEGPVIWRAEKCMGCRYCMVSCPFDIPKFEFNSPVPTIQKCNQCWDRLQENEHPACVDNCPEGTLLFGKKRQLLEVARTRIAEDPLNYVHHIYGEREVGGTGVLYLASVPFEQLGFKTDLGNTAFPEYTKGFLYSVPFILLLWPAILLGMSKSRERNSGTDREEE